MGSVLPQAFWHFWNGVGFNPSNKNRLFTADAVRGRVHEDAASNLTRFDYSCGTNTSGQGPYEAGRVAGQPLWEIFHGKRVAGNQILDTYRPATDTDFLILAYWAADLMAASTFRDRWEFANRVMQILELSDWPSDAKQDYCDIFDHHELDDLHRQLVLQLRQALATPAVPRRPSGGRRGALALESAREEARTPSLSRGHMSMAPLSLRPKDSCRFDLVSLGEVMLRLDPGDTRIHTTRSFQAWEGGGEYNVARGLRRCFGLRTALVSAFVDNPVGRLLEDLILQGGVDQSYVRWVADDGVGRTAQQRPQLHRARLRRARGGGLLRPRPHRGRRSSSRATSTGTGSSARRARAGSTRAASSPRSRRRRRSSRRRPWQAARKHGTLVSYDLNYRASLWKSIGGKKRAQEVNRELAALRRRDARQRGGLHRGARLRGGGPRRAPDGARPRELPAR